MNKKNALIINDETTDVIYYNQPTYGFGLAKIKVEGQTTLDLSNISFEDIQIIPRKLNFTQRINLFFKGKIK